MRISHDRQNGKLWLSQEKYSKKILDRLKISKAKEVFTSLAKHFKLNLKQCPLSEKEKKEMKKFLMFR